jgi:hypothetical protein
MNNTTTKRNLALAAVFIAATLVVGTFAVTTTTIATTGQSAFAYSQKKKGGGEDNGKGNGNGNTVTIEECKNKGSASGFDTAVDQECENLICTHPGNNATCVNEGQAVTGAAGAQPVKNPCVQCFTTFLNAEQIANVTADFAGAGATNLEQLCALLPEFPENELRFAIAGSPGGSLSLADQVIQCLKGVGIVFPPVRG